MESLGLDLHCQLRGMGVPLPGKRDNTPSARGIQVQTSLPTVASWPGVGDKTGPGRAGEARRGLEGEGLRNTEKGQQPASDFPPLHLRKPHFPQLSNEGNKACVLGLLELYEETCAEVLSWC